MFAAHLHRGGCRGTPVVRPPTWAGRLASAHCTAGDALDDLDHGVDCEGPACGDDTSARDVVMGLVAGETACALTGAASRPASHSPGTIIRACAPFRKDL
jgi:hypothetical protein